MKRLGAAAAGVAVAAAASVGAAGGSAQAQQVSQMPDGCWMVGPLNLIAHALDIAGYCETSEGLMWFDSNGGYGYAWWHF